MYNSEFNILIIAGEASGDIHGSGLVNALRDVLPKASFSGLGGKKMRAAKVHTFFDIERMGTIGVMEILGDLFHYWKVYQTLSSKISSGQYDAAILIDYPTLNLRIARLCRQKGCPVFFFISPQIWAWRKSRIKQIRRDINKMFVVLPFEEKIYSEAGVNTEFVGHPFLETVRPAMTREEAFEKFGLIPGRPVVGLLPGSRKNEINSLLQVMVQAAGKLKDSLKECQFMLPIADTVDPEFIHRQLGDNPLGIKTTEGQSYDVMNCCDSLIIASGSATLEAGILGCPMVIVYRLNWLTYFIAKVLIKTEFIGLVTIVAGEKVAEELIQHEVTADNIARESLKVLNDPKHHQAIRSRLLKVRESLGKPGVMQRIAAHISNDLIACANHEKVSI